MSLSTGGNHPTNSHKLRFQGTDAPVIPTGLGVAGLGRVASTIAKMRVPESAQQVALKTAQDGPMAIVPLETSVLVGRSERAYRRDGWLELQERLTEEVAAAVVWLFGVGFLQNQFEKVSSKLNKGKNQHLSTNIAWNMPWKKVTHVDLTPQEMFAKNHKEINTLLQLKSARWLFSVGTALALVGYFIPKGNQLKTNMILKHLERRKRASEGSNVQFGDPSQQNQPNGSPQRTAGQQPPISQMPAPPHSATSSRSLPPHVPSTVSNLFPSVHFPVPGILAASSSNNQPNHLSTPVNHSLATQFLGQGNPNPGNFNATPAHSGQPGVRFGAGLPGLSAIQAIGSAVEQTNYGQLLAVDFGIAGGRGYVASKRSPYETAEVLFRDIVSLYFYILCAPHLMKLITSGMDKTFGSSSHLQPKVVELLHEKIEKGLQEGKGLDRIIYGLTDAQMEPEGRLKEAMRAIDKVQLKQLLDKEARVYLGNKALHPDIDQAIQSYLKPSRLAESTKKGAINPSYVQHLLDAIESGRGAFGQLSIGERQNLGIAVKQATRHSVGLKIMNLDEIASNEHFAKLFTTLNPSQNSAETTREAKRLEERIRQTAKLDGMDQTHSMLRRSANVLREKLMTHGETRLLERGDALANWLDNAVHHAQTIEEHMETNLENLGERLHGLKLEGTALQQVRNALGRNALDSKQTYQQALKEASSTQIHGLGDALSKAQEEIGNPAKLWPFKTQAGRLKALNADFADLRLRLEGGNNSKPAEALKESLMSFLSSLKEHNQANAAERDLLSEYYNKVNSLVMGKQGRFFSLAIRHEDEALSRKLRETLRGGLISDSRLVSRALETVGQLESDTRKMPSTTNETKMRSAISSYTEALYKRYNPANIGRMAPDALLQELKAYRLLNRNLHYVARGLSLGTAMACIGWLVPIVQTKITKHLTGKDNNPGIASAKKLMDDAEAKEGQNKGGTSSTSNAQAGKTATSTLQAPPLFANSFTHSGLKPFQTQQKPAVAPVVG